MSASIHGAPGLGGDAGADRVDLDSSVLENGADPGDRRGRSWCDTAAHPTPIPESTSCRTHQNFG
jgi:hypothetical protein